MGELLNSISESYGHELDALSRAKISRYLEMLASTGSGPQDSSELLSYGLAYLEQLHNPDPRYTGC